MADARILQFRPRSRVPHDVLYIFPTDQLLNATPAINVLERYGAPDPQGLVKACLQGQLEAVACSEEECVLFSSLRVPAQYATNEVHEELKRHVKGILPPYGLERIIAKAVYLIQLDGTVGGHHVPFHGSAQQAITKYERWVHEGAAETLAKHLKRSTELATTVLDDNKGRPVYAIFGIQTADDAFVLEKSDLEGPFRCSRWGDNIIVSTLQRIESAND